MRLKSWGVILFVFIWALIGAVPFLRHQTERGRTVADNQLWGSKYIQFAKSVGVLEDNSTNPFWLSQNLQIKGSNPLDSSSFQPNFFKNYDDLIAKYPTDLQLYRTRLRLSTNNNIVPEEHTYKYMRRHLAPTDDIFKNNKKALLTTAELEQICTLARRGASLASNDAFFPFIEAMALTGLHRVPEAVTALERASRCTDFNDGNADESRQRIAEFNKKIDLGWDEKLELYWTALWPHLAKLRALIREISYAGVEQYEAGHKVEAWRYWNTALKASTAYRKFQFQGKSAIYVGLLVGEAMQGISIIVPTDELMAYKATGRQLPRTDAERGKRRLEAFVKFAEREGHPEAVAVARQNFAARQARLKLPLFSGDMGSYDAKLGWKSPASMATIQIFWFGWSTLVLAGIGTISALCAFIATRADRESHVKNSTVWSLSSFFIALWVGAAFLALRMGAGTSIAAALFQLQAGTEESYGFNHVFFDWGTVFYWFLFSTIAMIFLLRIITRNPVNSEMPVVHNRRYSMWILAQILLWLFVLCTSCFLWLQGKSSEGVIDFNVLFPLWLISIIVTLFVTWTYHRQQKAEGKQTFRFACYAALALGCSVLLINPHSDSAGYLGILLAIVLLVAVLWHFKSSWRDKKHFVNALRSDIEVCGRVMANLALTFSILYLVSSVALWPVRQQMEQKIDNYIGMGEIEWMKAQK